MLLPEKSCVVLDISLFAGVLFAAVQRISTHSIRKFSLFWFSPEKTFTYFSFFNSQHRRYTDDGEFEEIIYKRDTPLIWRSLKEYNLTESENCRNSEQGVNLIADERGFICTREDLLATGCCSIKADNTHLYHCDSCNEYHCCEVFENCVSCCLNPDNVSHSNQHFVYFFRDVKTRTIFLIAWNRSRCQC